MNLNAEPAISPAPRTELANGHIPQLPKEKPLLALARMVQHPNEAIEVFTELNDPAPYEGLFNSKAERLCFLALQLATGPNKPPAMAVVKRGIGIFSDDPNEIESAQALLADLRKAKHIGKESAAELLKDIARQMASFEGEDREQAAPKKSRFIRWSELMAMPDPEPLITGLLYKEQVSMLTAKERSFKSFIALDMAMSIATKKGNWQGQKAESGTVIYVAAEGARGTRKRAAAWAAHHKKAPDDCADFVLVDRAIQLASPEEVAEFVRDIKAENKNPILIVLDTLRRCAIGLDENSSKDMSRVVEGAEEIARQTGAHVMVLHHNNKSGSYSGNTALPTGVATHLTLNRSSGTAEHLITTLEMEKQKDFEEAKPISFEGEVVPVPGTQGRETSLVFSRIDTRPSSRNGPLTPQEQRTLEALKSLGPEGATPKEWKAAAAEKGVLENTFNAAKRTLTAKNMVETISGEQGAKGVKYSASEQGVKV